MLLKKLFKNIHEYATKITSNRDAKTERTARGTSVSKRLRGGWLARISRGCLENNRPGRNDALSFLNRNELVGLDTCHEILLADGPHDGQTHRLARLGFAQPEGERQFALRQLARTGFHHAKKPLAFVGFYCHVCADAVTVRARAHSFHSEHVVLVAVVIAQQSSRPIVGGDEQIEVAVIVEVAVCRAAADDGPWQRRSELGRDFLKLFLAQIAEQMRRLSILEGGLHHADVIGNVAVDGEKIEQAVQIVVKE